MRDLRNIVIFGNARWREDTCGNSSQQLAIAFLKLGYRVIYISPNVSRPIQLQDYSSQFQSLSISRQNNRRGGSQTRPECLSTGGRAGLRPAPTANLLREITRALSEWKGNAVDTVFICSMATTDSKPLLNFFHGEGFPIIYRYVDWFDPSNTEHCYDPDAAALACRVANVIAISHPQLVDSLPSRDHKVITVSNGVDLDLFELSLQIQQKPPDLVKGDLTVGFWGTFWGNRIDWNLIRCVADRNRTWQWNFIGELQYLDIDVSSLRPNVHFLGLKKKEELPAYVKHFDLCLIPYRQDLNFAKFANPIKALESLAALKPVVAPPNASLRHYPALFFYSSVQQAEIKIQESVSQKLNKELILDFVRRNTWKEKARELLNALNKD